MVAAQPRRTVSAFPKLRRDKKIKNIGSRRNPQWVLTDNSSISAGQAFLKNGMISRRFRSNSPHFCQNILHFCWLTFLQKVSILNSFKKENRHWCRSSFFSVKNGQIETPLQIFHNLHILFSYFTLRMHHEFPH